MAAGDQVTLEQVQAAYPVLSAAQLADLPAVIAAASSEVARRFPRVALRASFDETHEPGESRTVRLSRRPVLRVARVRADMARVLTVAYSGAGRRASAELVAAGESGAMAPTGLSLAAEVNGAAVTPVSVDFATHPTLDSVCTAVNALAAAGWSASAASGQGTMASTDLEPADGVRSALGGGAGFWGYTRDLAEYHLRRPAAGELLLYQSRPQSYAHPGCVWGTDPRTASVRVLYEAGLNAPLPDVQRAVIIIVGDLLESTDKTGLVDWYQSPSYSYRVAPPTYRFPDKAERILSVYRDRRFG